MFVPTILICEDLHSWSEYFAVLNPPFLKTAQKAPFRSLKIGLSHTYGGGVTQTDDRGVTQTVFEVLKGGAFRVLKWVLKASEVFTLEAPPSRSFHPPEFQQHVLCHILGFVGGEAESVCYGQRFRSHGRCYMFKVFCVIHS